jgi:hypothetical protein
VNDLPAATVSVMRAVASHLVPIPDIYSDFYSFLNRAAIDWRSRLTLPQKSEWAPKVRRDGSQGQVRSEASTRPLDPLQKPRGPWILCKSKGALKGRKTRGPARFLSALQA